MVKRIVAQTTTKNIGEMIAERGEHGWDLYLAKRQLITKTNEDTYTGPASTGPRRYSVEYGGERESCDCGDYQAHRGELSCQHPVAVALLYARRRNSVPEAPTVTVGAAKRRDYLAYFGGYATMTVEEDGREHDEAVPCQRCKS